MYSSSAARHSFLRHSWWRNINLSLFLRLAGVTLPSVGREWQIFCSWWNENAEIQECLWDFSGHLWPAQGQGPLPRWRSTGWSCCCCRLPQIHTILNIIGVRKPFLRTHTHFRVLCVLCFFLGWYWLGDCSNCFLFWFGVFSLLSYAQAFFQKDFACICYL